MDDARKLQYGIEFDTSDASNSVDDLDEQVSGLEDHIGAMEMGARNFGSGAVSACRSASDAVQNFGASTDAASKGVDDLSAGAKAAGDSAQEMGGQWNNTGQDIAQLVSYARTAADALKALSDGLEDLVMAQKMLVIKLRICPSRLTVWALLSATLQPIVWKPATVLLRALAKVCHVPWISLRER